MVRSIHSMKYLIFPLLLLAQLAVHGGDLKPGQRFEINSKMPKYDSVLLVFDLAGKAWPSFCYGRPDDGGHWIYDEAKPQGSFGFQFTRIAQEKGDQSRRVLGETVADGATDVRIRLISVGEARDITIDYDDDFSPLPDNKKSPGGTKVVSRVPAVLEFTIGDTTCRADAELRVKDGGKTSIEINAFVKTTGAELGLENHTGPLGLRLWLKAYPAR